MMYRRMVAMPTVSPTSSILVQAMSGTATVAGQTPTTVGTSTMPYIHVLSTTAGLSTTVTSRMAASVSMATASSRVAISRAVALPMARVAHTVPMSSPTA